ncbi:hypothetical protein Plhal304r1_c065g0152961 [Plasmopara halstedii]
MITYSSRLNLGETSNDCKSYHFQNALSRSTVFEVPMLLRWKSRQIPTTDTATTGA